MLENHLSTFCLPLSRYRMRMQCTQLSTRLARSHSLRAREHLGNFYMSLVQRVTSRSVMASRWRPFEYVLSVHTCSAPCSSSRLATSTCPSRDARFRAVTSSKEPGAPERSPQARIRLRRTLPNRATQREQHNAGTFLWAATNVRIEPSTRGFLDRISRP